ncbi:MAG TPA: serine hydrolase [Tepidisphaeraceae bacterium]|jgi:beta-lactamase class A
MPHKSFFFFLVAPFFFSLFATGSYAAQPFANYVLDYTTPVDPQLQSSLEKIDATLLQKFHMTDADREIGLLDLNHSRLAMLHPDREEYAASVAKIGILLAYFVVHPDAATHLDPQTQHELGMMAKASNNEMASKFSHEIGLKKIQSIIDSYGFYDARHGGGLWMGRHYGGGTEVYRDPVGNNSHAVTVRQALRYFLLLEQDKLVSPAASAKMRDIFASPDIPFDDIKFVKGLKGRDVQIIRKWGTWNNWLHDCAVITGPGRHYILIGLTHHANGDDYLTALAPAVDDLMQEQK